MFYAASRHPPICILRGMKDNMSTDAYSQGYRVCGGAGLPSPENFNFSDGNAMHCGAYSTVACGSETYGRNCWRVYFYCPSFPLSLTYSSLLLLSLLLPLPTPFIPFPSLSVRSKAS